MHDAIKAIEDRFKSGNDIPVTRASITIHEWNALKEAMQAEIDGFIAMAQKNLSNAKRYEFLREKTLDVHNKLPGAKEVPWAIYANSDDGLKPVFGDNLDIMIDTAVSKYLLKD